MREYSDVVIVGAGASGLMAGALLSREGLLVTILDKNDRQQKNYVQREWPVQFTNLNMNPGCFFGRKDFIEKF